MSLNMRLVASLLLISQVPVAAQDVEVIGGPSEVATRLQAAISRPGHDVELPAGRINTNPFGVAVLGGQSIGHANIRGQGRNTVLELAPGNTEHGVLNLNNQGDWFDSTISNIAFYGNGNEKPIVNVSGYSLAFRDLFIRATSSTTKAPGIGLRIFNGQHFILDNVQAEFCDIGIHLDAVSDVSMTGCNTEFCDVGLLLTKSVKVHTNITVNGLYCESTGTGIRSEGVPFTLIGGVYISDRMNRNAVELIDCQSCYIDQSHGSGKVYLDAASSGNLVIVPGNDQVFVEDHGQANTVRTVATPSMVAEPSEIKRQEKVEDKNLRNWDIVHDLPANTEHEIEYIYSTTKFAQIISQFYDQRNREIFDHATQQWVPLGDEKRASLRLPWQTGQVCKQVVRLSTGNKDRKVQVRFLFRDATGSTVTLYSINRL